MIDDGYGDSDLPQRWKLALGFADRFLTNPRPATPAEQADLDDEFGRPELTELALGLGLFHGFSKVLIALGQEPETMETTVYPTPAFQTGAPQLSLDDRHAAVLSAIPELAARWLLTYRALWDSGNVEAELLEQCRVKIAQLLEIPWAAEPSFGAGPPTAVDDAIIAAELFVLDVRAIEGGLRESLRQSLGEAGLVTLFVGFALWDGIYRVALTT